jgi:hypothetical protein
MAQAPSRAHSGSPHIGRLVDVQGKNPSSTHYASYCLLTTEQVVSLQTGEALLFAPAGLVATKKQIDAFNSIVAVKPLAQDCLLVRSRLRITQDGGRSFTAIQEASAHSYSSTAKPRLDSSQKPRANSGKESRKNSRQGIDKKFHGLVVFLREQLSAGKAQVTWNAIGAHRCSNSSLYPSEPKRLRPFLDLAKTAGIIECGQLGLSEKWARLTSEVASDSIPM